jgi:hypothetical protein
MIRSFLAMIALALLGSQAQAQVQGTLHLTANDLVTSSFHSLTVDESNGQYSGSYIRDADFFQITDTTLNAPTYIIKFGNITNTLQVATVKNKTTYVGTLGVSPSNQAATIDTTIHGKKWVIGGSYGSAPDITGKAKNDSIEISWNDKTLTLNRLNDFGDCDGSIVRTVGTVDTVIMTFNCDSNGTLKDAFFTQPKHVVAWLVNLFVNLQTP